MWHHAHLMDAMAGTHLVPPAFALPAPGTEPAYATEVIGSLADYERKYGPRGTSEMTTEKVPLSWTCGPVRVIDVRSLVGTTARASWPASPEITPAHIQAAERAGGDLKPGEIVVFHTGHLDRHLHPQPQDTGVWTDPLTGKSEGWPAPGPDAIVVSEEQGDPCVATDAPDLGGVDPETRPHDVLGPRQPRDGGRRVLAERRPAFPPAAISCSRRSRSATVTAARDGRSCCIEEHAGYNFPTSISGWPGQSGAERSVPREGLCHATSSLIA